LFKLLLNIIESCLIVLRKNNGRTTNKSDDYINAFFHFKQGTGIIWLLYGSNE
jgi:hypothetical protein